jgi:cytochrome c-type biogenesis protein CcmH/NrfG
LQALLKTIGAIVLLIAGLVSLYKPGWIIRFNAWCRERLFNDSAALMNRRKIGLVSIVVSSILFYSGFSGLSQTPSIGPRIEREMFEEAQQAFQAKRYNGVVARCQALIRQRPEFTAAWQLLGSSWLALGKRAEARVAWQRVAALDPNNPAAKSRLLTEPE